MDKLCGSAATLGTMAVTQALKSSAKGSIFFLHGPCDTGSGMQSWLRNILKNDFQFKDYKVIYPSSPVRSYTPHKGQRSEVWYDSTGIGLESVEDLCSLNPTAVKLSQLILKEKEESGIPLSKMIIGGFSMGGSMALHLGYRLLPQLAGVFALSTFLPPESVVYSKISEITKSKTDIITDKRSSSSNTSRSRKVKKESIQSIVERLMRDSDMPATKVKSCLPRLFMSQGNEDPLVLIHWSKSTFKSLRNLGVEGFFYTMPEPGHEIRRTELMLLHGWIKDVLGPDSADTDANPITPEIP